MKLKCDRCGYEWEYKGKLNKPLCISCKKWLDIELNEVDENAKDKNSKSNGKRART